MSFNNNLLPVVCLLGTVVCGAAAAAELDVIRERGELVWAADQEGGGPHVFLDPADPARLTGFEVELAALIAAELGVKPRFQQGQWDRLPLLLGRTADRRRSGNVVRTSSVSDPRAAGRISVASRSSSICWRPARSQRS